MTDQPAGDTFADYTDPAARQARRRRTLMAQAIETAAQRGEYHHHFGTAAFEPPALVRRTEMLRECVADEFAGTDLAEALVEVEAAYQRGLAHDGPGGPAWTCRFCALFDLAGQLIS